MLVTACSVVHTSRSANVTAAPICHASVWMLSVKNSPVEHGTAGGGLWLVTF